LKKAELRCPVCGSLLHRQGKAGFICPNSRCEVIKVHFDRNFNIKRIYKQGLSSLSKFGKDFS